MFDGYLDSAAPDACGGFYDTGDLVRVDEQGHVGIGISPLLIRRNASCRYPAAVADAYRAVSWAYEHAVSLGGDPRRIVAAGDSAGGNRRIRCSAAESGDDSAVVTPPCC